MPTLLAQPKASTLADLIAALGDVPLDRIRLDPAPGKATERDLRRLQKQDDRLYELVDGTLVEKAMGWKESSLTLWLVFHLMKYLEKHDIGEVCGADGRVRLRKRLVRIPDIAFVLWENAPSDDAPAIPELAPDLAVEVISPSNTPKEMARKRKEYFKAGTKLVWQVYGKRKEVEVFTSPSKCQTLGLKDALDGGDLLPGFRLPLIDLFVDRGKNKRQRKK